MKCRNCNNLVARGCGYTSCAVDEHVIMDFDADCKFTEEEREKIIKK
jgi:hypothetical protein